MFLYRRRYISREELGTVNPFTRIALEAAVLIIGFIVIVIFLAYLGGAFTLDSP